MRRFIAAELGALCLLPCVVTACGGEPAPRSVRPSLLGAAPAVEEAYVSPARYRYHPQGPATLLARAELDDGRVLLVGQRGERWLVDAKRSAAEAASELAPEDLVSVGRRSGGGWLFLGKSGTSYEADEPIGRFVRSSTPLDPLVKVRASEGVLVGVRRDGALVRSDNAGASWTRVGPESGRFADVALRPDGRGLALEVPEALWETADAGATWKRRAMPSNLGVEAVTSDEARGIVLVTAFGPRVYAPGEKDEFPPLDPRTAAAPIALRVPAPLGPTASALLAGRAVLTFGRWIEVRAAPEAGNYRLLRGPFDGALEVTPFSQLHGCADVRLSGFGKNLYAACARQKNPAITQPLEVFRSMDQGGTWKPEPYAVDGKIGDLRFAVGVKGELLVTGVCAAATSGAGCRPAGVHVRTEIHADAGPPKLALVPAATPSMVDSALALAFSYDGRVAYAVGKRSKSESLAVFTSHDGGATFEPRDVESLALPEQRGGGRGRASELDVESLAAAEDGSVSVVVEQRGIRRLVAVDDEGRSTAVARPPVDTVRLGAAGSRAFAIDAATRETWESVDAGASWISLGRVPADPCLGARECAPDVACTVAGCVIGNVLTRVGWKPAPRGALLAPPGSEERSRRGEPKARAPYTCALDAGEWRRITGALGPPFAEHAAIGKAAWFVLRHDPATAAVSVLAVKPGKDGAFEETRLLEPGKRGEEYAYTGSVQIEGAAAARYRLPTEEKPALSRVEVAWFDVLFGRVGHAVIPDGGAYRPGDFEAKGRAKFANLDLLSIATGGVYVRLHASLGDQQPTFFLDGRSVDTLPPSTWPEAVRKRGHTEMAHVGRAHVPLRLDGPLVMRARVGATGSLLDAYAIGYARPADFGLAQHSTVAYANGAAGVLLTLSDVGGRAASGLLYPFRAEGPVLDAPVRVPTQLDVPSSSRPCRPDERSATPRVVVPFQPGARHPILVVDPVEPMRTLLTADAVLHGTPESPCVAAYEAVLVSVETGSVTQPEHALLFPDSLERAWLFRAREALRDGPSVFEYRTMSCRLDPSAEVPTEVFSKDGMLVPAP